MQPFSATLGVAYTHAMRSVADDLRDELQEEGSASRSRSVWRWSAARGAWPGVVPPGEWPRPEDRDPGAPTSAPSQSDSKCMSELIG